MNQFSSDSTPELETENLLLRTITERDCDAFFEIFSDGETLKYWSGAPISKRSEAEALVSREISNARSEGCINWGIELADNDVLVGKFTLFSYDGQNRRAEVGYLLNRKFWGQGIMSEVMSRVLDFAFSDLDLHRLEADTDPQNLASLALLEKFGFEREGYFRQRWYVQEQWLDSVMLGLLREDYHP